MFRTMASPKKNGKSRLRGNRVRIQSDDVMKNLGTVFEDLVTYWDDIPVCKQESDDGTYPPLEPPTR